VKPTVVYIITKLELGGAQKICLRLFDGLNPEEIRTMLISGNEGVLAAQVQNNPNVILLDSFKREISLRLIWAEITTFIRLVKQLRALKKQNPLLIVHTHSTKAGLVGRWAAFFAGIKQRVHTIHGYAFHDHQPRLTWWAIYLLELATSLITTHFVCVSSADVKTGKKLFPRFERKYSIIRAAVDFEQFAGATRTTIYPAPGEPFVFGTVSCFKSQKNIVDMIRAFNLVHTKNPHTRLEIIGDGVMRPIIEQTIQDLNLTSAVTLRGWQSPIAPILAQWHAFILSSLWEGLPCAVVEARLMKLPVLAYHTGGIYEVIKPGFNGFLFSQKNWQGLGQAMFELTRDEALHKRLRNAPDKLDEFHEETMLKRHTELYLSLYGHTPTN
jgi:glycosyltransferase involved in cell wall biosynthesis